MNYIQLFFVAIRMFVKAFIDSWKATDKYNRDMKAALNFANKNGIIISYRRN